MAIFKIHRLFVVLCEPQNVYYFNGQRLTKRRPRFSSPLTSFPRSSPCFIFVFTPPITTFTPTAVTTREKRLYQKTNATQSALSEEYIH
jgi:hypothetical protein